TLLGGVQILVDGGRLVFKRSAPDPGIIRDLWALLPTSTRPDVWPATFAFGNKHGFHVLVTPDATRPDFDHHVPDASAGDYPEGRYEYGLQKAAEDNDQGELDALLSRCSRRQTMKMAAALLVLFALIVFVMRTPIEPAPQGAKPQEEK